MRRSQLLAAVILSACVGLVGGATAAWAIYHRLGPVERVVTQPVATGSGGGGSTLTEIAADAAPSVVTIATQGVSPDGLLTGPKGFANGFVATADGLVVTTVAGVSGATQLRVALADGRAFDALVAGTDVRHGLVLLRAAGAHDLTPLSIASQTPKPGDFAMVVARPPLQGMTIASGTVSSTAGKVDVTVDGVPSAAQAIAVSTASAAADEGAPLLDDHGAVVGVVTHPPAGQPASPGVLALLSPPAADMLTRAAQGRPSARASLGTDSVLVDPATAAASRLSPGALIRSVVSGGPMAQAGIVRGDIVTQLNGVALDAEHPLDPATFHLSVGQRVTVTVVTDGGTRNAAVTVGSE